MQLIILDALHLIKVEKNLRKINAYLKNGYIIGETLILTFESGQQPLNTTFIDRIIEHYFL